MFGFFNKESKDITRNAKVVKQWIKEHELIKKHAVATLEAYNNGQHKLSRKELNKLEDAALKHLMDEDNKIFELIDRASAKDEEIVEELHTFRSSFRDVKHSLVHFLITYSDPEKELDEKYRRELEIIINAVVDRIEFEERALYPLLNN